VHNATRRERASELASERERKRARARERENESKLERKREQEREREHKPMHTAAFCLNSKKGDTIVAMVVDCKINNIKLQ